MSDPTATVLLVMAWPVLMAYAAYRIVIAVGANGNEPRPQEKLISAFGGVLVGWGRVMFDWPGVTIEWSFTLTVVGVALLLIPKVWGLFSRDSLLDL